MAHEDAFKSADIEPRTEVRRPRESSRRDRLDPSGGSSWASRSNNSAESSAEHGAMDVRLFEFLEELTRRIEAGEPVDVEEAAREHPAWADDIRELLPALRGLADLGLDSASDQRSHDDNACSRAGKTYGDFRIIREIGRGGMGIVYEAEQVELGRRVALKVLPLAASLDPRALQRFRLEAQVAGWLQHPRIVPVIAVGTVDDVPYYAMQYIEGGSLADLIAELRELIGQGAGSSATTIDRKRCSSALPLAGLLSGRFTPTRRATDGGLVARSGCGFPTKQGGSTCRSATGRISRQLHAWEFRRPRRSLTRTTRE